MIGFYVSGCKLAAEFWDLGDNGVLLYTWEMMGHGVERGKSFLISPYYISGG